MMSFSEKKKDQILTPDRDNTISHCPTRRLTRPREPLPISPSVVGAAGYLGVTGHKYCCDRIPQSSESGFLQGITE